MHGTVNGVDVDDFNEQTPFFISLGFQDSPTVFQLETEAFRGLWDATTVSVSGNEILMIPSRLFGDESSSVWTTGMLDLSNLGVEVIEDDAFVPAANATNVSIDLTRNYVRHVSPMAFHERLAFNGTGELCVDVPNWRLVTSEIDNTYVECGQYQDLGDYCERTSLSPHTHAVPHPPVLTRTRDVRVLTQSVRARRSC